MNGLVDWWNGLDSADLRMESGDATGAGIVAAHSKAIRGIAQEYNTFILIRPTNSDSTRLIKQGYATKSMDIHDKSSDWGPMAGFVPADPAFNKKRPSKPSKAHAAHGAAQVVQLQVTDALLIELESANKVKRLQPDAANARRYKSGQTFSNYADHIEFLLRRQGAHWMVSYNFEDQKDIPLQVWAYNNVAVTGDYDLWMVAPHITYLTTGGFDLSRMLAWKHSEQSLSERGLGEHKAESAATTFLIHLLPKLNEACNRGSNPVFMHGAENRNYGFTQELDKRLAIYTPGGRATVINMDQFATVIAEMSSRGYLPVWNVRYDGNVNDDPMFNGKTASAESPLNQDPKVLEVNKLVKDIFGNMDSILAGDNDLTVLSTGDFPIGSDQQLPAEIMKSQMRIQRVLAKAVQLKSNTGQPDVNYVAECLQSGEKEGSDPDALSLTKDVLAIYNYWQRNGDSQRSAKMKELADLMARQRTVGFDLQGKETRV